MVSTKAAVPMVRRAITGSANPDPSADSNITMEEGQESHWSPEALEKAGSALKALNRMAKRPPVHILFEDISYTVTSTKGERKILYNVSGELRSGELTCILGPSGAGKSTLLNILTGYTSNGVTGRITVNGHARDMRVYKKLSTYIMQDDLLQPRLTVLEAMRVAAALKLGQELGSVEKELIIKEILQTIGLWNHKHTMSECLSGGQMKRLSIALELVNNPPIIFLDEPTTGLDVVSIRQLVVLLRLLSRQGRTIVCTVHQPSATLFGLFDRIYVMSKGMCSYQGVPELLVPHLAEAGYICPTTYNPADFVMETLQNNVDSTVKMIDLCQNGKLCSKMNGISGDGRYSILDADESMKKAFVEHISKDPMNKLEFPTSFLTQFFILSKRMFIQNKRNRLVISIQLGYYLSSSLLVGGIFYNVGNNAAIPIVNFKFCLSCLVFLIYSHIMIPVLIFPFQVRLLRREYFNRWYSLKAYYAALSLSNVPAMVLLGMTFMIITYLMSGQILDWRRFLMFSVIGVLIAICSEGFGIAVGSMFNVSNGCILAPVLSAPLLCLSCYGMGFGSTIESSMRVLMGISYMRYGVTGFSIALYQNRDHMECPDLFCLYSDPKVILRDLGMTYDSYWVQIVGLLVFTILHRLFAYLALKYRLTAEFSSRYMNYVSKFLKHR